MVVDVSKLREALAAKGHTQQGLADAIGMARSTLFRKLKGGGQGFRLDEVQAMAGAIPLTRDEAIAIFFAEEVA